mmetsp:Transcript_21615/g.49169  ORF Transcript_21615/g.49169 Transcript_21615/m.49169 type:complete len:102 (-) Transcript_21615:3119-3424(-)
MKTIENVGRYGKVTIKLSDLTIDTDSSPTGNGRACRVRKKSAKLSSSNYSACLSVSEDDSGGSSIIASKKSSKNLNTLCGHRQKCTKCARGFLKKGRLLTS